MSVDCNSTGARDSVVANLLLANSLWLEILGEVIVNLRAQGGLVNSQNVVHRDFSVRKRADTFRRLCKGNVATGAGLKGI
jgi:uncharacterized membrane-anchored protein